MGHHHLTIVILCITIIAPIPVLLRSACSDPPQVIRVARGQKVIIDYWIGSEDHQLEEKLDAKNSPPQHETTLPTDLSFATNENPATPVYDTKEEFQTYLQELITEISTHSPELTEDDLSGKAEADTGNYQLDGITETGDNYFIYLSTLAPESEENPETESATADGLSEKSYFGIASTESAENQPTADSVLNDEVGDTTDHNLSGRQEETESVKEGSFFSTVSQLITTLSPLSSYIQTEADIESDIESGNATATGLDGRHEETESSNEESIFSTLSQIISTLSPFSTDINEDETDSNSKIVDGRADILNGSTNTILISYEEAQVIQGNLSERSSFGESNITEDEQDVYVQIEEEIDGRSNETELNLEESPIGKSAIEEPVTTNLSLHVYNTSEEVDGVRESKKEDNVTLAQVKSLDASSKFSEESFVTEEKNLTSIPAKAVEGLYNTLSEPSYILDIPEEEFNITGHEAKSYDEHFNSSSKYQAEAPNATSHIPKSLEESLNSSQEHQLKSIILKEANATVHFAKSLEEAINNSSEYKADNLIIEETNETFHVAKSLEESLNISSEYQTEHVKFKENGTIHVAKSFEESFNSSSEHNKEFYLSEQANFTFHTAKSLDELHNSSQSYIYEVDNSSEHVPKSLDDVLNITSELYTMEETNNTDHIPKSLEENSDTSDYPSESPYIFMEENSTASSHDPSARSEDETLIDEETIISTQYLPREESTSEFSPMDATESSDTETQRPQFRQPVPIFIRLHDSRRSLDKVGNESSRVRSNYSPVSFVPTFRSNNNRVVLRMLRQRPHAMRRNLRTKRSSTNSNVTSCEWLFKSEPGVPMLLTFRNFSTPQNPDCLRHYIAVERESNGFESRWCGPTADRPGHAAFARSEIRIRLYSEGQVNIPAGFSVEVQALDLKLLRKYAEVRRLIKTN